jgi:GxxExxY protein
MLHSNITGKIIAAAMAVHTELGNGFQETIYQRALALELRNQELFFKREQVMDIFYKKIKIGTRRADFFVQGIVMLEIKAVKYLELVHLAQARNYLESYNLEVGLLINFGATRLEFKRVYNKKQ